ncbi:MAG TPA: hypothetical protein VMT34_09655, partial [Aggregatilineales bacterium]|nr:hypothetical protein [Aggregatilineales bacterium]
YAGLLATVRLAGKARGQKVQITRVSASDSFVERLRLHQSAANQAIKHTSVVEVTADGIMTGPEQRPADPLRARLTQPVRYDEH